MSKHILILTTLLSACYIESNAQISIIVDAEGDNRPISPYLYGKNTVTSDKEAETSAETLQLVREAGIRMARQDNGNNATKYNWRKKLTSHPDWYNNVEFCDWDKSAQTLQKELPEVKGLYAFQLIGKAAKTRDYNFDSWAYNKSQGGSWVQLNLCGGGSADASGNLIAEGDPDLYLEDWPADSTVAIYPHWRDDLGLDMDQFNYWEMDNEMEIWQGTHDDVVPLNNDSVFEQMMQNYFATAKAIRKIAPDVKICGPVVANEWSWFYPGQQQPTYNGKTYCWLEYFIMRCAEEEKKSGVKMFDVFDIHFYPNDKTVGDVLQTHRVLWDRNFSYALSNGLKTMNGHWDNSLSKEYILGRCEDWFAQYFGDNREIPFAISEYNNSNSFSAMVNALCYASFIGEGMRHGMEYFTPWVWKNGMYETVHLFSHYAQTVNVSATSSNDSLLSAYASVNVARDSMSIILLNRAESNSETVNLTIGNFNVKNGTYPTYQLANLPDEETFVSDAENALQTGSVAVADGMVSITVPALSMTAIVLPSETSGVEAFKAHAVAVYPNPTSNVLYVSNDGDVRQVDLINGAGQMVKSVKCKSVSDVKIPVSGLEKGSYVVRIYTGKGVRNSVVMVE